jgi:hypothetical protein
LGGQTEDKEGLERLLRHIIGKHRKGMDRIEEFLKRSQFEVANVHNQKPLVEDELKFVALYPEICHKNHDDVSSAR